MKQDDSALMRLAAEYVIKEVKKRLAVVAFSAASAGLGIGMALGAWLF